MEELDQEPTVNFVKGFNSGYLLQKHEPELLDKVMKSDNDGDEYIQAMKAGQRQQKKETLIQEQKAIKERQQQKYRPKMGH